MRTSLTVCSLYLAAAFLAPAAVDNGLLALVPSDTRVIGSIDVQRESSSEFGQYLLNRLNAEDQNIEQFAQQTGFDPRRDLQDLIFCSPGTMDGDTHRFAILARGYFDEERIDAAAKAKGTIVQTYQGVKLYVSRPNQQPGFAFLDVGIAVLADRDTLQRIIGNRTNPSSLDPALQQLISKVGPNNDAWFASLVPGPYLGHGSNQNAHAPAQALQSITQSSGGILFGSVLRLSVDATARSAQDATSLADVVRFGASMVQMQRQKDPRANIVASALDKMDLRTDGNTMHFSISLPEASLEQIAESSGFGYYNGSRPTKR